MKYLVIGAGGVGGSLAANLSEAGHDVTAIARGAHLQAMLAHGLHMHTTGRGAYTVPVKVAAEADYQERPDVIFVCVKDYSLMQTVPLIHRVAGPRTIVIPLLNIYGTGARLQELLPRLLVTDGCIYIAAQIKAPGLILQSGHIFRIVFGLRQPEQFRPDLNEIAADLRASKIEVLLSQRIKVDTFNKYVYVSPLAACEVDRGANAGSIRQPGPDQDEWRALTKEIIALGQAMGLELPEDLAETNFQILRQLSPNANTSLTRDYLAGRPNEIDGQIFQVVRLGRKYGVALPGYERIAAQLGFNE
ncbi:MAG: 2-dehydropantoate 2-reductase [Clostridia bacterium]|nr:2-dehydropantoate 2-reductase [Clostridia bacterium]